MWQLCIKGKCFIPDPVRTHAWTSHYYSYAPFHVQVGRFKAHGPGSESRLGSISMNSPGPQAAATGVSSLNLCASQRVWIVSVIKILPYPHIYRGSTGARPPSHLPLGFFILPISVSHTAAVPAWQTGGADQEVLAVKFDPIKMVIYTAGNDQSIRVSLWNITMNGVILLCICQIICMAGPVIYG